MSNIKFETGAVTDIIILAIVFSTRLIRNGYLYGPQDRQTKVEADSGNLVANPKLNPKLFTLNHFIYDHFAILTGNGTSVIMFLLYFRQRSVSWDRTRPVQDMSIIF